MFHVGKANPKSYVLLSMFNCCFLERSLTVHLRLRCKHFGLQGRVKTFLPKYIYIFVPTRIVWSVCCTLLIIGFGVAFNFFFVFRFGCWVKSAKKGECYTRYCVRLRIVFITNLYGFQWIGVLNCFSKPQICRIRAVALASFILYKYYLAPSEDASQFAQCK